VASYRKLPSPGCGRRSLSTPAGKRFTRTDPLKRVVIEWAEAKHNEIRRGEFVDPNAGRITLSQWWTRWKATWRVERATSSKRRVGLVGTTSKPYLGEWPIDVHRVMGRRVLVIEASTADRTRERQRSVCSSSCLHEATRHKLLRIDPSETIDGPRGPEACRPRSCPSRKQTHSSSRSREPGERPPGPAPRRRRRHPASPDEVNQLFVLLMLEAGLRWEEAAGLHGFRVDLMRRMVRVQEVVERGRRIKPRAEDRGQPARRPRSRTSSWHRLSIGTWPAGMLLSCCSPRRMAGRSTIRTGSSGSGTPRSSWPGLREPLPTPHDCRHSYGSWLAENGVRPGTRSGTSWDTASLRAVERYIHTTTVRMERARNALDARRSDTPGAPRAHGVADHAPAEPGS
jgi:integrase